VIPFVFRLDEGADGTVRVLATPNVDDHRYPTLFDLDLRLAKTLKIFGRANVLIAADLFNARMPTRRRRATGFWGPLRSA
jgi:hypothetical protein